ncbi:hypothetical protein BHE74_00033344, partial [Ensete ventricosum]
TGGGLLDARGTRLFGDSAVGYITDLPCARLRATAHQAPLAITCCTNIDGHRTGSAVGPHGALCCGRPPPSSTVSSVARILTPIGRALSLALPRHHLAITCCTNIDGHRTGPDGPPPTTPFARLLMPIGRGSRPLCRGRTGCPVSHDPPHVARILMPIGRVHGPFLVAPTSNALSHDVRRPPQCCTNIDAHRTGPRPFSRGPTSNALSHDVRRPSLVARIMMPIGRIRSLVLTPPPPPLFSGPHRKHTLARHLSIPFSSRNLRIALAVYLHFVSVQAVEKPLPRLSTFRSPLQSLPLLGFKSLPLVFPPSIAS